MIDITGPPSTISATPRPHTMPQRSARPARKTSGRNARPDHKKRCISKSAGVNPTFRPCRVATKPSAQNSAAPRPHATPNRPGVAADFWGKAPAPLVGSFIADAYVSSHSSSTYEHARLTSALATRQTALPSRLQFQPAHEITFADRRTLVPDNVIRCCCVKKEVGQRERH